MFRRAFTLVELLVVIAIVGILAALLLPAINALRGVDQGEPATVQGQPGPLAEQEFPELLEVHFRVRLLDAADAQDLAGERGSALAVPDELLCYDVYFGTGFVRLDLIDGQKIWVPMARIRYWYAVP